MAKHSQTVTSGRGVAMALALSACVGPGVDESSGRQGKIVAPLGSFNVLTRAYDDQRSNANLVETQLTTENVNRARFGKLFQMNVDDELYASLLYASGVVVGGEPHNVIYAATVSNTIHAFDADNGAPLWSRSYNGAGRPTRIQDTDDLAFCFNVTSHTGITGTPVIDGSTQTMYFVTHTLTEGQQQHRLHAVEIATGREKLGGPVAIEPNGFDSRYANQRPALALSRGVVYVAFASHCDAGPYHGWLLGFDAATLGVTATVNVTPGGTAGGIWMGGAGPAFDAAGNLYITTGNGSFDGSTRFGTTLLKLSPRSLARLDYFTPSNFSALNDSDLDFGSAGPSFVPGQDLIVNGGKGGKVYLVDSGNLGHIVDGDTQIPQRFTAVETAPHPAGTHHIHNGVVLWKSAAGTNVYVWGENDFLRAYRFDTVSKRFETPAAVVGSVLPPTGMPGGMMTLSANGSLESSGILWATIQADGDANNATVPGVLHAFDASSLRLLWDSRSPGDDMLSLAKYNPPLVANGKVYVASFSGAISAYGLRTGPTPPLSSARYRIRLGTRDGLCVDVEGASTANAAPVQQYTCNGSDAQRWNVTNVGDNSYELRSAVSDKCLDVTGGSSANGTGVQQYACNGSAAQRWAVEALGAAEYRLVSQTGERKCLDVPRGSDEVATRLQVYTCNGTAAQTLTFALDNDGDMPVPDGSFRIETGTTGNGCLDARRSLGMQGELRQLPCNGTAAQRFRFQRVGSEGYQIRAAITERCLDVDGASSVDGATVQQYLCNESLAQRWNVEALGNGKYQFLAQTGVGRCLDVEGASSEDGARLQQWTCNGTQAQTFTLIAP